jgi:hypothetical protein
MRWGDRVSRSPTPDEARASDTKILLESRCETIIKVKVLQMFSIFVRHHADSGLKGMLMHAAERAIIVYSSYEKTRLTELAPISLRLAGPVAGIVKRLSDKRLSDLLPVVRDRLYNPGFEFSNSIKSVARLSGAMSLMAIWMKSRTALRPRRHSGRWQVGGTFRQPVERRNSFRTKAEIR